MATHTEQDIDLRKVIKYLRDQNKWLKSFVKWVVADMDKHHQGQGGVSTGHQPPPGPPPWPPQDIIAK